VAVPLALGPMPRRNLIPYVLLAVLTVLALVFAVLAITEEPTFAVVLHGAIGPLGGAALPLAGP